MSTRSERSALFDEICDLAEACECTVDTPGRVAVSDPTGDLWHTGCPVCAPKMIVLIDKFFGDHETHQIQHQEQR